MSCALASSTQSTYKCHRDCYLAFCRAINVPAVPASQDTIQQYAALLARSLKFSSVKQYLNIIRLLHLSANLPNPLQEFNIHYTLRGIQRTLGCAPSQKLPITPDLLMVILKDLNLSNPTDAAVWSAALMLFYSLLRRGNVLVSSWSTFDSNKHLCQRDVRISPVGLLMRIRWTKTIQFRERELNLCLPRMRNHVLCPVESYFHYHSLATGVARDTPVYVLPSASGPKPLSPVAFTNRIRLALQRGGFDSSKYAGHSFRRGGASWALKSGLSVETIRQLGDWRSLAYMNYIHLDDNSLGRAVGQMQSVIRAHIH